MRRLLLCPVVMLITALLPAPSLGLSTGEPFGPAPWLVADLAPGSDSSDPQRGRVVRWGDRLIFAATPASTGMELFVSDGTKPGTHVLKDLVPGAGGSSAQAPVVSGGRMYFQARDAGGDYELYTSDGTSAGTHQVADLWAGGSSFPRLLQPYPGGKVVFSALVGGNWQLWISDGTAAGTHSVGAGAARNFTAIQTVVVFGSSVIIAANDGLRGVEPWVWDGTDIQPNILVDLVPGASGSGFPTDGATAVLNGRVYSAAQTSGDGTELYGTDGTPAGTAMVRDINPGSGSSNPAGLLRVGDTVYFAAVGADGEELWVTDGTLGGTVMLRDINPGAGSSEPRNLVQLGSRVLFTATDVDHGVELWATNGSPTSTRLLADVNSGSGDGVTFLPGVTLNGELWFTASDPAHGQELWRSDGTPSGSRRAGELMAGAADGFMEVLGTAGNTVFVTGDEGVHGVEVWALTTRSSATRSVPKSSYSTTTAAAAKIVVPVTVKITGTTATGTVTIKRNGVVWGSAKLVNGIARVRLTKALGKGIFTGFKAYYSGSVRGRLSQSAGFTIRVG